MILIVLGAALPLTDPVLKFLIILLIILIIPIISDKVKIPHLLGMIIAGVLIGPHGFNLLARDSSIILSGTAGLLYVMFLAGLEIDMQNLNRQLDILKTGSTTEIETLMEELHNTRRDLTLREDRLREAEKELEDRNARLIELQEVLAQKEQAVKDLRDKVMRALVGFTDDGLTVHEKNGKVYVSMDEKLLFKTGRWDVDPNGQRALRDLSKLLAENPDINIMVEGHTDDVPMRGAGDVKDNWDLSVMRATAVTKILTQNPQLDPERIIAAGRSEYVPLVPEKTPEARQMNRRTEIILTPKLNELLEILESN